MVTSAIFAALHHLLAFTVVAVLAVELALVRPGMSAALARSVSRVDAVYGASFGLLVAVGIARIVWFEKGLEFYLGSPAFWAKMALLAVIGLLSVPPTIRFLTWRKAGRADPDAVPPEAEIASVRRWLHGEGLLFLPVLLLAALLARGY